MLEINQKIQISDKSGELIIDMPVANEIEMFSSRESFTDNARVVLPQKFYTLNENISDYIKPGYKIDIFVGYGRNLVNRFSGYISRINQNTPLTLECEDEAYLYKFDTVEGKKYEQTTLSAILDDIYNGEYVCNDLNIGDWVVKNNATLLDFLSELKNVFGFLSFWQEGILYVNAETLRDSDNIVIADIQGNVPVGTDNLEIQDTTDKRIVIHGVSPQTDGSSIETYAFYNQFGDIETTQEKPAGYQNELKFPNLTLEALKLLSKQRIEKQFYTGIVGDVTIFGEPVCIHGDFCKIIDKRLNERDGIYEIESVLVKLTQSEGYKQVLTLGARIQ